MIMHSQLDISGVQGETGQHKIKRSMRLLLNVMAVLYNRLPHPKKGETSAWAPNTKEVLTRVPMYRKALPFP